MIFVHPSIFISFAYPCVFSLKIYVITSDKCLLCLVNVNVQINICENLCSIDSLPFIYFYICFCFWVIKITIKFINRCCLCVHNQFLYTTNEQMVRLPYIFKFKIKIKLWINKITYSMVMVVMVSHYILCVGDENEEDYCSKVHTLIRIIQFIINQNFNRKHWRANTHFEIRYQRMNNEKGKKTKRWNEK